MVSKEELGSYLHMSAEGRQKHEGWASRNIVLGSMLAGALLVTAAIGSTMEWKPHVDLTDNSAISELSTSAKPVPGGLSAFELMSRASDQLPVRPDEEQAI